MIKESRSIKVTKISLKNLKKKVDRGKAKQNKKEIKRKATLLSYLSLLWTTISTTSLPFFLVVSSN
jgi:phage tail tube protein FII